MPNRKSQSSSKTKSRKTSRVSAATATRGQLPPYGVAIRDALASGDVRQMRKVATATRKWLRETQAALAAMEKSVKDLED